MKDKICQRCNGTGFEPDPAAIGKSMRKLREISGKQQKEVAKAMGISAAYLSDMELGRRDWSADTIAKFKKAL